MECVGHVHDEPLHGALHPEEVPAVFHRVFQAWQYNPLTSWSDVSPVRRASLDSTMWPMPSWASNSWLTILGSSSVEACVDQPARHVSRENLGFLAARHHDTVGRHQQSRPGAKTAEWIRHPDLPTATPPVSRTLGSPPRAVARLTFPRVEATVGVSGPTDHR